MIFDSIKNRGLYERICEKFSKGFDFIEKAEKENLAVGRYDIDGDNIYAMVQSYNTRADREGVFEAHGKYIDIQYIISGAEEIDFAKLEDCEIHKPYDESIDAGLYTCSDFGTAVLKQGDFAIFFEKDAHRPGVGYKEISAPVQKIVVKVKI